MAQPSVLSNLEHLSDVLSSTPVSFIEHTTTINNIVGLHNELVDRHIATAGFQAIHNFRRPRIDHALLHAMVERWRPETHTFHLAYGEATVTLEDVSILSGLLVDGPPVTGSVERFDYRQKCIDLFGRDPLADDPRALSKQGLKITWLTRHIIIGADEVAEVADEQRALAVARAIVLMHLTCSLMPDSSSNRVPFRYLPLVEDLGVCGQLSWGSATLAALYDGLNRFARCKDEHLYAFCSLLQVWVWEHIHISRPEPSPIPQRLRRIAPYGARWSGSKSFTSNVRTSHLMYYRNELDIQAENQIIWMPYVELVPSTLPAVCFMGSDIWRLKVFIVHFNVVVMHAPDRVMAQFGLAQHIPDPIEHVPHVDARARHGGSWTTYHQRFITKWTDRRRYVVRERRLPGNPLQVRDAYLSWYWSVTKRWIQKELAPVEMKYQPQGPLERAMADMIIQSLQRMKIWMTAGTPLTNDISEWIARLEGRIASLHLHHHDGRYLWPDQRYEPPQQWSQHPQPQPSGGLFPEQPSYTQVPIHAAPTIPNAPAYRSGFPFPPSSTSQFDAGPSAQFPPSYTDQLPFSQLLSTPFDDPYFVASYYSQSQRQHEERRD